jgi:competence protein ComEC
LPGAARSGFSFAAWRADIRLADHLDAAGEGQDVEVVGVVASLPQDFSHGTRFEFDLDFGQKNGPTVAFAVPSRVMLSWYQGRRDDEQFERRPVRPGERWRFTVRLKRPHGNANPGGFDYEAWLLERNIRATGYVRPNPPQRLSDMVWRPDYAIERLRFNIRASFARLLPEEFYPWAGVLVALAVGDQKAINGDLWTTFNRTGTTHLMSISGLHVTMVAALFGWLVSFGWRRSPRLALALPAQKAGLLAACLAALVYALLAGFAVPAQRTLIMMLVAAAAMLSGRIVAPSRILALALLVVLLVDPWACWRRGSGSPSAPSAPCSMWARHRLARPPAGGRGCARGASSSGRRRWPRCRYCCLSSSSFRWFRRWPTPWPFRWSASSSRRSPCSVRWSRGGRSWRWRIRSWPG